MQLSSAVLNGKVYFGQVSLCAKLAPDLHRRWRMTSGSHMDCHVIHIIH